MYMYLCLSPFLRYIELLAKNRGVFTPYVFENLVKGDSRSVVRKKTDQATFSRFGTDTEYHRQTEGRTEKRNCYINHPGRVLNTNKTQCSKQTEHTLD